MHTLKFSQMILTSDYDESSTLTIYVVWETTMNLLVHLESTLLVTVTTVATRNRQLPLDLIRSKERDKQQKQFLKMTEEIFGAVTLT